VPLSAYISSLSIALLLNYSHNGPIGVLAQLGLARAYAISDDRAKARDSYQEFLKLWKDADPEIPILREAQSQYAKLKGR
jgi:hypothetical protein